MTHDIKITALAGGVGGAKLSEGLSKCLPEGNLTVIVNTCDDMEFLGLHISPDLDTVCYTLAGLANPDTGWGLFNETWEVFKQLEKFGGPNWFHLGDRDLALHLERTRLLKTGQTLSEATNILRKKLGVTDCVLPMTDESVRTLVHTKNGRVLGFQEYFVKEKCEPEVSSFEFSGIENSFPTKLVINAIQKCDLIVICPSNPFVSIDPILSMPGFLNIISEKTVVAVSPIIGGKTIKGPAAKMFTELGIKPSAFEVAKHYKGIIKGVIIDTKDANEIEKINRCGIITHTTDTIMRSREDRIRLADETIAFGLTLVNKG
jgi:LPPG:FO 2-phospho-L-lactate transferase